MPGNDEQDKPAKPPRRRCKICKEPIVSDGYGDWVHWDGSFINEHGTRQDKPGFYMCEGKEGEVAAA